VLFHLVPHPPVDTDVRHLSAEMLRFNSMMLASGQLAAAQNELHKPATICWFRLKQNDSSNQDDEVPPITPEAPLRRETHAPTIVVRRRIIPYRFSIERASRRSLRIRELSRRSKQRQEFKLTSRNRPFRQKSKRSGRTPFVRSQCKLKRCLKQLAYQHHRGIADVGFREYA